MVTMYKIKYEQTDCNSYRGIFFLSIVGEFFAFVILVQLQQLAERVYPEQCGFHSGQTTIDIIFQSISYSKNADRKYSIVFFIRWFY